MATKYIRRPAGLTEAEAFAWFMPGNPHYIRQSLLSNRVLARELGVAHSTISNIRAGHWWKHI